MEREKQKKKIVKGLSRRARLTPDHSRHSSLVFPDFRLSLAIVAILLHAGCGWLKCCFTSTETIGLLGTGAQDIHLDFHTAPELCRLCPCSVQIYCSSKVNQLSTTMYRCSNLSKLLPQTLYRWGAYSPVYLHTVTRT